MSADPKDSLEHRFAALEGRVAELELEVQRLRSAELSQASEANSTADAPDARAKGADAEGSHEHIVPLLGRTVLILGGAFLLRAITEQGMVPQAAGSALGLVYGLSWLVLADRGAGRRQQASAAFHGIAASLIVFPLLLEVTEKFHFLSPAQSAIALAATCALGFFVAWHRSLRLLAWVMALGATPTAAILAFSAPAIFAFGCTLLTIALGTLCLAYLRRWTGLRWVLAAVTDLYLLFVGAVALANIHAPVLGGVGRWQLVALQLGLTVVYLGAVVIRTAGANHQLSWQEALQGLVSVFVGVGGALLLLRGSGAPRIILGAMIAVGAATLYAVALFKIAPRRERTYYFYTGLGFLLALAAVWVLVGGSWRPVALALCALLAAAIAGRYRAPTLYTHAAVYVTLALVTSGTLAAAERLVMGAKGSIIELIAAPVLVSAAAASVLALLPLPQDGGQASGVLRVVRALLLTLVLLIAGAMATGAVLFVWHSDSSAAVRAPIATLALALVAVLLVRQSRKEGWASCRWLAYVIVAGGGIKVLLQDLLLGGAGTAFVSLVIYGSALMLVSRLSRSRALASSKGAESHSSSPSGDAS